MSSSTYWSPHCWAWNLSKVLHCSMQRRLNEGGLAWKHILLCYALEWIPLFGTHSFVYLSNTLISKILCLNILFNIIRNKPHFAMYWMTSLQSALHFILYGIISEKVTCVAQQMACESRSRVQQNDLLLHEAVIKNEPAAVREALQRPTDVNCRNNVSTFKNYLYLFHFIQSINAWL